MSDPIVDQLQADGIPVTRESYITLAWGSPPLPWMPMHEACLPPELQDWTLFTWPTQPLR